MQILGSLTFLRQPIATVDVFLCVHAPHTKCFSVLVLLLKTAMIIIVIQNVPILSK